MMLRQFLLSLLLVVPSGLRAAESVDYVRDVQPILKSRCYACHGALRKKGSLRLDTAALAEQGGDSGPGFEPGNAADSYLIERILAEDDQRMPPQESGERLDTHQIALLRAWIDQGAPAPDEATPNDPRDHWSYRPPVRPSLPPSRWARNPVDAFIAAEHQSHGLTPSPEAAKHVLLRRVYLDLIGLPPTPDQLQAFLNDSSEDAYEQVVDQLLASPRYGERWGRHWMDVWRYSDWSGFQQEIRNSQRHVWRWRDWIVQSLNENKGYDQMVHEMLAGDELAPTDPDTLRATGYLARSWFKFNRNTWLDGTVEHVAKAFLGVTINCARCHDHKFDPIDQEDYYRLRAFFEPHDVRTDRVPREADPLKDGVARVLDLQPDTPTYVFTRGNDLYPETDTPLQPQVPGFLGGSLEIHPVELPLETWYPALQAWVIEEETAAAQQKIVEATEQLNKSREQLAAASVDPASTAFAVDAAEEACALADKRLATAMAERVTLLARIEAERAKYGKATDEQKKGLAEAAGGMTQVLAVCQTDEQHLAAKHQLAAARRALKPEDKPSEMALADAEQQLATTAEKWQEAQAALAQPSSQYEPLGTIYPKTSTGRRLALARWITDRQNPLAARVAINHIWLRHMGGALVDNMFDLGLRSDDVRNLPLLDWLAVELMENQWSLKHIHRLIVTSNTYRMTSASGEDSRRNLELDEDNRYLWRMNSRPLEGEGVRDSLLHVAGNLDLQMGGPEMDQNAGQTSRRRSIYFRHAYEKQMKFLELFDGASVNECYRRSESVVPQQALAMANSRLSLEHSRLLAARLWQQVEQQAGLKSGDEQDREAEFVRLAFRQILNREATDEDRVDCLEFLRLQCQRLAQPEKLTRFFGGVASPVKPSSDPRMRARENLVHVICNHNDFLTIR